jgi:type IV secretory pathway TrbD component
MIRRSLSIAAGSLTLAIGIGLRLWTSGNFARFGSGFFLGVAIALLIQGLAQPSRRRAG